MAYADFGSCWIPSLCTAVTSQNQLIDAAGEMAAFIFIAPATGNITGVSFMTATVTTGDTVKVSLQDVDPTTGDPDGVVDQSVTQVINSTDDNTVFAVTFGAARSVTKGDIVACVIEFDSFVAGNINIRAVANTSGAFSPVFKNIYVDLKTGGTWAKSTTAAPLLAVNYGGTYYPMEGVLPPGNQTVAFNNSSTPDERALYFNSPVPLKADAICALIDLDGTCDLVLYDSDGTTALATVSLDPDIRGQNVGSITYGQFSSAITLAKNTNYRVAVKPTSATNVTLNYVDVSAAALLAQLGCGTAICMSTRTDAGAWTETTTQRPAIFLHATAFDDGAGTGGGAGPFSRIRTGM